jgi:hypothetical protein
MILVGELLREDQRIGLREEDQRIVDDAASPLSRS